MKNLFFVFVVMAIYSCSPKIAPVVPSANVDNSTHFVELDANIKGFTLGNQEIVGPVKRDEIEGALVSISGSFIATPEAEIDVTSRNEKGGIIREVTIKGGDLITFSNNSHFLIYNSFWDNIKKYPDSVYVKVKLDSMSTFCMAFKVDQEGNYVPSLVEHIETFNIFSDSILIKEDSTGRYVRFRDGGKVKNEILPIDIPKVLLDKNGALLNKYSIEKIPLYEIDAGGDTIPIVKSVVNYEVDDAGYKFISPCGDSYYLSNKNILLNKIYVKQDIDDRRQIIESGGYKSPNE